MTLFIKNARNVFMYFGVICTCLADGEAGSNWKNTAKGLSSMAIRLLHGDARYNTVVRRYMNVGTVPLLLL
jgi:hypothetical protein